MALFTGVKLLLLVTTIDFVTSEHRVVFKSNVRHSMNKYEGPKKSTNLQLSAWELNLVNEALVDIMVSKCSNVYPEEADDLKSYISEQIAAAPVQSSMNSEFVDAYANLIKCLDLAEISRRPKVLEDETKDGIYETNPESTQSLQDLPFTVETKNYKLTKTKPNILSQQPATQAEANDEHDSEPTSSPESKSEKPEIKEEGQVISKTDGESKPSETKTKEKPIEVVQDTGLFGTVGHLFTKLYENTVDVISWFGRKKRQTGFEEMEMKRIHHFRPKVMQNMKKHSFDRVLKKNNLKKLKSHKRFTKVSGSVMSAKIHFNEMLDSIRFIAHTNCPAQLLPITKFVNDAINEMLFYIYEDLKNVEAEGQKLSVDLYLQKRVAKCVADKEA